MRHDERSAIDHVFGKPSDGGEQIITLPPAGVAEIVASYPISAAIDGDPDDPVTDKDFVYALRDGPDPLPILYAHLVTIMAEIDAGR